MWTANHTQGYIQPLDHAGTPLMIYSNAVQDVRFLEEQSIADILVKKKSEIKLKVSADEMQS